MPRTDAEQGGEEARERFEASFNAHYADLLAFALRRVDDRHSAEDVVAETFAVAWRRRDVIPDRPLAWLYAIALRVIANQRRARGRRRRLTERLEAEFDGSRGVDHAEAGARRDAFATAFGRLSDGDREVLRLVAWDGLAPAEAARVIGCSHGAFRVRLHRARRRLEKQLAASGHKPVGRQNGAAGTVGGTE
jgi:RNA polymerase sigma-70 factor (ECF subfamily)